MGQAKRPALTERQWLTAKSVVPLRDWCQQRRGRDLRKERLFASACCRRFWDHLSDERSRAAIGAAEKFADGLIDKKALAAARLEATRAARATAGPDYGVVWGLDDAVKCLLNLHRDDVFVVAPNRLLGQPARLRLGTDKQEEHEQARLLRDIFGNPFRPVAFDPSWRSHTAVSLARSMYEGRDFTPMPILADALQDAGRADEDVLSHCRGDGPHVRGCWVVDLVLGKE
jgi:hypothetical protein